MFKVTYKDTRTAAMVLNGVVLVSLLLTWNIFHSLFLVFLLLTLNMYLSAELGYYDTVILNFYDSEKIFWKV